MLLVETVNIWSPKSGLEWGKEGGGTPGRGNFSPQGTQGCPKEVQGGPKEAQGGHQSCKRLPRGTKTRPQGYKMKPKIMKSQKKMLGAPPCISNFSGTVSAGRVQKQQTARHLAPKIPTAQVASIHAGAAPRTNIITDSLKPPLQYRSISTQLYTSTLLFTPM